jgi:S-adenosylmethionine hydrolase
VKGYLLKELPEANIVDITHQVEPFNIGEAAFVLRNCFCDFPLGTMHLIGVEGESVGENDYILVKAYDQYFFCQDNGLLSLALEKEKIELILSVPFTKEQLVFPLKNVLAPAAVKLVKEGKPEWLGKPKKEMLRKSFMQPLINEDTIQGTVIYIDEIGNGVTNVRKEVYETAAKGRKPRIFTSRRDSMKQVHHYYDEVPEGEKLCFFGSHGRLEIAINKGNAAALLGLKLNTPILIEFE